MILKKVKIFLKEQMPLTIFKQLLLGKIQFLKKPQKVLKIDGMIRPFSKDFVLEDQAKQIANNFIIQGLDKELMEDLSGYKFLPYVFELSALSNLSLEPIWRPTSLKSTRHFGYAIQWFALALVVLFGGYYLFRKKQST